MNEIIEALKRKSNQLRQDYTSHFNAIKRMADDPIDINSVTFEPNMISHLVEMNSIKGRLREIEMQIDILSLNL